MSHGSVDSEIPVGAAKPSALSRRAGEGGGNSALADARRANTRVTRLLLLPPSRQVFWGQEHLNCLVLVHDHLQSYLQRAGVAEAEPEDDAPLRHMQPPPFPGPHCPRTEHSSDDLRTGLFQYIQDTASQKLPATYEVVFYNETDDCPGVMLWRYPEPRVLTFVRITPVPFNTTEDPDISTADLGDVLQVPCSLEYWDELQRAFVPYREFSLSESSACELQLPAVCPGSEQKELVASDLWRVVVNSTSDGGDEQSSDSESGSQVHCEQLVSPTALAACTRVDSCFAPWFVPSVGVSLQLAQTEVHLCHHLEQLGTAPAQRLRPFLPDRKLPQEQEYLIVGAREPRVYLRQWSSSGGQLCQELHFSTELDCRLLEYRNLTLMRLVRPFGLHGQASASRCPRTQLLDANLFVEPVFLNISQYTVHTLDTALQAWNQNQDHSAEELFFSHYVICNDTHETLRFGQVDTDENVLLASLHSHQYSWRSHKSPQLLHICIEGWGNWRWSEPFSVDNAGTLLRTIQYKGRTASLIIKVQQLSGVQKQIVICGRQVMCSYLGQDIELRVVQHYVGPDGQTVVREHVDCLEAGSKLPSYVLEDAEMTELCVRARGDEDWSQDVCLERREKGNGSVVQVPCSSGSLLYVWCTLLTIEPDSHMQQRVVVFSPLFLMRSHLPDPVIIHIEKRNLGLRESQVVPGQGHEEPLLNVESDLTHHLTFQAREQEDASQCAVPISSGLIKQIVNKTVGKDDPGHVLSDFYGAKSPPPPGPTSARTPTEIAAVSNEKQTAVPSPMSASADQLLLCRPRARGNPGNLGKNKRKTRGERRASEPAPRLSGIDGRRVRKGVSAGPLPLARFTRPGSSRAQPTPASPHLPWALRSSQTERGTFGSRVSSSLSNWKAINSSSHNFDSDFEMDSIPRINVLNLRTAVCLIAELHGSETLTQWDSPMQVKLCAWKAGLNTLLIDLLPWALLANHSHWDLWLFEGEKIVLQIPAGRVIVPPNFKEAFQIGIYWAHSNTVHKSTALKLVHDLTSPRWKEGGGGDVVTLDEEGFVEAEISLGASPGPQKLCQLCVSSAVRHGIQILQIEDRTVLLNNTPHLLYYRALLSERPLGTPDPKLTTLGLVIMASISCRLRLYPGNNTPTCCTTGPAGRPYDPPDTAVFALPPGAAQGPPQPASVPCWDLLREGAPADGEVPPPIRHMLFSSAPEAESGGGAWSLPAPIRPDFPRQGVAAPREPCGRTGLVSRALVLTYQEHLGVTYLTLNEDPYPRLLVHNKCPIALLLKENVRGLLNGVLPAVPPPPTSSSLHHELYHHSSSFPDCRQREALPTLLLRATDQWSDPIDINCPGTQVPHTLPPSATRGQQRDTNAL
ncbi:hypothetical protein AAFF_G00044220 [Aldrovandia affinis]|uniref:Uncharacterized protein n=1 Tax=Aldrovandia affinis TaxID=143900 RepID=A0AAD7WG10_9TELE|nr:hypothetical protein AAFF_G00044220 [Aldrovandia affinis]